MVGDIKKLTLSLPYNKKAWETFDYEDIIFMKVDSSDSTIWLKKTDMYLQVMDSNYPNISMMRIEFEIE